jgi:hypothetical protein
MEGKQPTGTLRRKLLNNIKRRMSLRTLKKSRL